MALPPLQNLDHLQPIVETKTGIPTQYFIRFIQNRKGAVTDLDALLVELQAFIDDLDNLDIIADAPLNGGGNLGAGADIHIGHDDSGVTANTYGDATHVAQITVDDKGHVTNVTDVAISGGGGGSTEAAHFQWQRPSNTSGGTNGTGWQTRPLDTVIVNGITGASLASNKVTIPAGTYFVTAAGATYRTDRNQLRIYDTTNSTTLVVGLSDFNFNGDAQGRATQLAGVFTVAGIVDIEVQHSFSNVTGGEGLGVAVNTGEPEVFTNLTLLKVA